MGGQNRFIGKPFIQKSGFYLRLKSKLNMILFAFCRRRIGGWYFFEMVQNVYVKLRILTFRNVNSSGIYGYKI